GGAGRVLAWTPPRTCGRVIRPPAVRHARGEWAATFWTWWHGWRGARFGMPRCVCRIGGAAGEPESKFVSTNWLQKEAQGAAPGSTAATDVFSTAALASVPGPARGAPVHGGLVWDRLLCRFWIPAPSGRVSDPR